MGVGGVLGDRQVGLVAEDLVEHLGPLAQVATMTFVPNVACWSVRLEYVDRTSSGTVSVKDGLVRIRYTPDGICTGRPCWDFANG